MTPEYIIESLEFAFHVGHASIQIGNVILPHNDIRGKFAGLILALQVERDAGRARWSLSIASVTGSLSM